ncbi:MAG: PilZ domain-containing protein [Fibrobacteres bacterium]|nr:PilZ domain-containing protein [Fibrobacterota bacterium]
MAEIRKADRIQQLAGAEDYIIDASATGIALTIGKDDPVVQGKEVLLEVSGGSKSVQLRADVVYVKKTESGEKQAGFKYLGLTDVNRNTIADMIDAYSKGVPIRAKIIR